MVNCQTNLLFKNAESHEQARARTRRFENPKFEKWQEKVLRLLEKKKSVFVSAPTSAGKSILPTWLINTEFKVLYLVPTEPLVFQQVSLFEKMTSKKTQHRTCGLLTDNYSYNFNSGVSNVH